MADQITTAYFWFGVKTATLEDEIEYAEGEIEFVDACAKFVPLLHIIDDYVALREMYCGVFDYEVSEPFGGIVARHLSGQSDEIEELIQDLLLNYFESGGVEHALGHAIEITNAAILAFNSKNCWSMLEANKKAASIAAGGSATTG